MKLKKTDAEWQAELTPEQYHICRNQGTEAPFSGIYHDCIDPGTYHCLCCDAPLFLSHDKFNAGCGWPSFTQPTSPEAVQAKVDLRHGLHRIEITCTNCDAHLGHVFHDGPDPTGLRFCINSAALVLNKKI